jgi:predicted restriction endonuclease
MGKLRVDRNRNRYTTGKAPHKPTLLLSLITLHDNDRADLRNIKADLYLRETWSEMWNCLEYPRAGPIHLPMYHMRSDGF